MKTIAINISASRRKQGGFATILILILTGIALLAMTVGSISYVRGLQVESRSRHAVTQSQLKAWTAVEAIRQYLTQAGGSNSSLTAGAKITFSDPAASFVGADAVVKDIEASDSLYCGGLTRVTVDATGRSANLSASTVEAVYCVSGSAGTNLPGQFPPDNNIKGPLQISGGNNFKGNGNSKLTVQGDITGAGSITGYDSIYSTGNVNLSGYSQVGSLAAEGNIDIEGTFGQVSSMQNVNIRGGDTTIVSVDANGTVTDENGSHITTIQSIGDVNLTDGSVVSTVHTDGSVKGRSTTVSGELLAQGDFVESGCCSKIASGKVGGAVKLLPNRDGSPVNLVVTPGLQVAISPITAQQIATPKIDAYSLRDSANYAFDVDSSNQLIVKVKNVSSIPDGTYYIVGSGSNQDYVCTSNSYSASSCPAKICKGYSDWNSCFSYSSGSWVLNGAVNGTILAPGIAWFNGNLNVGSGQYVNSFLVTGNVTTSSDTYIYALDDADYALVCANPVFPALHPTDYCGTGVANKQPLDDIALLAGGYVGGSFSGGIIAVGSHNEIHGNIFAGDVIQTAGDTLIQGLVSSAFQGDASQSNKFGAKTEIDQSHLPSPANPGGASGASSTGGSTAKILWARYL